MELGRTPIVLLNYKDKHKAVERELIMNYENGNLYILQNGQLINITTKLIDTINNFSNDMSVNIEGIGSIKLNDILLDLINNKAKCVHAKIYDDSIDIIRSITELDNKSIEQTSKSIQMKGFDTATDNAIAIKRNGQVEWVDFGELLVLPGNEENPIDGLKGSIIEVQPVNDTIYLSASRKQKTINLKNSTNVILPKTLDQYSRMDWCVITNNIAPILNFPNNIIWKNDSINSNILKEQSFHIYIFESWDNGKKWLGSRYDYSTNYSFNGSGNVDEAYLRNNIYYKDETNELLSWKEND